MGSAVSEVVAENHPTVVRRVGLADLFTRSARGPAELLAHYGINARSITAQARGLQTQEQTRGATPRQRTRWMRAPRAESLLSICS